jgi:hypothetical protein
MPAFWAGPAARFLVTPEAEILGTLSHHQVRHFRNTEAAQLPAWRDSIGVLKQALAELAAAGFEAFVLLEYPILRLGRRIDAVLLTDRAVLVLEFKTAGPDAEALRQTEDYALDLLDFHEHCRGHAVVPVLVAPGAEPGWDAALPFGCGVAPVQALAPAKLGEGLTGILRRLGPPSAPLDPAQWVRGAYRPVPTIIEAACMLYARHGVAAIAEARADQRNLRETTQAIRDALAVARGQDAKIVLFVTGIPGAGKTLCGLNAAFGDAAQRGTFLTGNPTLVHVLREALARDAHRHGHGHGHGMAMRAARRRMEGVIQQLPKFRNHYVVHPQERPAERVVVIDEAQRCWSREYAVRKTRDKPAPLTDSEPGHLLDILGRHAGFAAMICLVGSGQEIHDGEGGLATWGAALRRRPDWRVVAAPDAAAGEDARRQLGQLPGLRAQPLLHLDVPVRQVRSPAAAAWVDAVLRGDGAEAAWIAHDAGGVPFWLVRDLAPLRAALRGLARGSRRAGLLASSGARRLRAEGLGAELPHMDAAAVAHWFLDRFPADVRASDALEQVATEFACQGLELDHVGLCWDADLVRPRTGAAWVARRFVGTSWQTMRNPERIANQLNTYRVLLTRARYETVIHVPRGAGADGTRDPALYEAIATFLSACGAQAWQDVTAPPALLRAAEPMLL